jgi:hypothetical protein
MPKALAIKVKHKLLTFSRFIPRKNLPSQVAAKRGESNFARAFERTYLEQVGKNGMGGSEFGLADFGIADFIWISWYPDGASSSAVALAQRLNKQKLYAFELKLTDWRKGLTQAFRYGYFADQSVLVLPQKSAAKIAKANLYRFKELHVGLWIFDGDKKKIQKLYTPRSKARSPLAKQKAIQMILAKIEFGQFPK